jgi:glutamate racemase
LTNNPSTGKPIGIFDSGIGGLTVLKEVISQLPHEDTVYLGDTARVPYGIRSQSTVIKYSYQNADFLIRKGIKALVVACNTVSAVGLEELKKRLAIPVIGVIEPGAAAAAKATTKDRIGVIGTEATINSGAYQDLLRNIIHGATIIAQPCPLFVPLVEEGWTDGSITKEIIKKYLKTFKRRHVDTLVLGCTHYPLLKQLIGEYLGDETVLIDSAVETAKEARRVLGSGGILRSGGKKGTRSFFVTDSPDRFRDVGEMFLGETIQDINLIDIA